MLPYRPGAEEEEQVIHRVRSLLNLRIVSAKDPGGSTKKLIPGQGGHSAAAFDNSAKAARWKKLFLSYDKDKSGTITFKELRSLIRNCLHLSEGSCTDNDLKLVFARLDEDGSGAIEFDEFCTFVQARKQMAKEVPSSVGRALRLAMAREKVRSEVELRQLFEKSDLDNDNNMSVYELSRFFREVLRLSQHEVSEFHIKKLFKMLDEDFTGSISQGEFLIWIQKNVDLSRGTVGFVSSRFGGSATMRDGMVSQAATMGGGFGHSYSQTGRLPSLSGPPGSAPALGRPATGQAPAAEAGRPRSSPWGQARVKPGDRRTYLSIPGAERLNHVEQRLFEAGFDVRGDFFKVSDQPEGASLSRTGLFRSTSGSAFPGRR